MSHFIPPENLRFQGYRNVTGLKWVNKGVMTGMILIDLQKAFDTTDHDVLLQKLCAIGFSKHTVNLFNPLSANTTKWSNTLKQFVGETVCVTTLWDWRLKG